MYLFAQFVHKQNFLSEEHEPGSVYVYMPELMLAIFLQIMNISWKHYKSFAKVNMHTQGDSNLKWTTINILSVVNKYKRSIFAIRIANEIEIQSSDSLILNISGGDLKLDKVDKLLPLNM